jgi:sarcosine oxidase subunit gamma
MDDARPECTVPCVRTALIEPITLPPLQTLRLIEISDEAVAKAAGAIGFDLPTLPNRWTSGPPAAARLGLNEWLVRGGSAAAIDERLFEIEHHVSDITAGRAGWRISGPAAVDLIAAGCSIDLHPTVFQPGACARTLLAQVGVLITRLEASSFELIIGASSAAYFSTWLQDAQTSFSP